MPRPGPLCLRGKDLGEKGVPLICRAVRRLLEQGIDAELHLAGEGELLNGLRREYGEIDRIRFLGHMTDPMSLMQSGHVGVMHSSYEGFPTSCSSTWPAGSPW